MARIYKQATELVGGTPLLEASNFQNELGLKARILVKLEYFNPGGSVKDRIAKRMIEDAEAKGILKEGHIIVEPTSGNTGIGLAWIGSVKKYRVILTMPETMSVERRNILKAYGAEIVLTPGAEGMKGAIKKAEELCSTIENAHILGQFVNESNPAVHYDTTGPEIWADTDGEVDILIAGVGTGGTVTGTGQYLKSKKESVQVIAVEPAAVPVLSGAAPSGQKNGIQGIGAGFVPEILDTKIYDQVITIANEDAYEAARTLAKTDGVLTGISSGAALHAAVQLAKKAENEGKTIVVILPDTGERYLSTPLFA